jgi:methylated-DNA-[protein]-cysteine S-methyltransferase
MTEETSDPLLEALAAINDEPDPERVIGRVVSRWMAVPGPVEGLFVAFGTAGISYVRTATSVGGDPGRFCSAYRDRFGRPLIPASRAPAGLTEALRSHRGRSLQYDLDGLSEFERDVLSATARIPVGETRPYGWVAAEIGRPRAVRAVGSALGRNPVPVLIPCHRVTRSGGDLGQYVFGEGVKEALLRIENTNIDEVRALARNRVNFVGSDTTRIVCFPTCNHARRITTRHRRGFRNVSDAEAAGYRPCLSCRPIPSAAGSGV